MDAQTYPSPLNDSSRSPQPCCIHLCCKTMYYRPDERPGRLHTSDTQTYWCDKTLERVGPDGEIATPTVCDQARRCFQGEG
jgi:hypothetical protein